MHTYLTWVVQGDIVNHNGCENASLGAHLQHLYSLLDPILTYGHGLLLDFLVMHRTVRCSTNQPFVPSTITIAIPRISENNLRRYL